MTINRPVWLEYIVWDYTDKWNPKIKGFKEDAPEEIVEHPPQTPPVNITSFQYNTLYSKARVINNPAGTKTSENRR